MKTKEELNALKDEYEALDTKFRKLTEDELKQVAGGVMMRYTCTNPSCILNDPNAGGFMCAAPDGALCPACQAGTIIYVYPSDSVQTGSAQPSRFEKRTLGDGES